MVGILRITAELFSFLVHQRAWWMMPIVAGLLLVGLLVALATASPLGPMIYTLW
jgi:hypothetical protein